MYDPAPGLSMTLLAHRARSENDYGHGSDGNRLQS